MRTILSNYARTSIASILAVLAVVLTSCGGSGVTTTTTITPTAAATIQMLVSTAQMPSAGTTSVDITAIVLSSSGEAVADQAVTFSTGNDPTAYFSAVSGPSDSNGVVTATLNLGADKSNRTITVTGTAGTAVGSNTVSVIGSAITISGNSSLTFGASTSLIFSVKDSAGNAMPGVTVALTSSAGNTLSPSTGTTDAAGQLTTTVTATNVAASDVITATAAGASKTQNLIINSSAFNITTPVLNKLIKINTSEPISLTWTNSGVPVAASSVNFSSSRGTLTGAAATTNGSGVATATISSNTTGSTIISAAGLNGTPSTSVNVTFYTDTASAIAAQANPGTVAVTTGTVGQTNNSSVISVVVRDASNNLVQNAQVNFSIIADVSGGHLSSATATTNSYGAASVNYIAGSVSSPQNGVIIQAQAVSINGVPIAPVTGQVTLTVSGQSLLVRLGTDNLVVSIPPLNQKVFVASVTDAAGNAVAGVAVSFKLRPNRYFKGEYVVPPLATGWSQNVYAACASEDNGGTMVPAALYANNGQLDAGEDINGNAFLDPGNATATITASGVTDANGFATATITYAKDHATWAEFILEARTTVNSNDPPATTTYVLSGLASDYTNKDVAPPGVDSPYGLSAVCTDPN